MLSHLAQPEQRHEIPETIKLLYATRLVGGDLDQVLFLPRLKQIFEELNHRVDGSGSIDLHLTDSHAASEKNPLPAWLRIRDHRITHDQIISALRGSARDNAQQSVAYICGPPAMTDEFVGLLKAQEGMRDNVFCEKWW